MALRMKLSSKDIAFLKAKTRIQLALEFDSPNEVQNCVEYFQKSVAGLNLRLKDSYIEYFSGPVKQHTLPSNMKSLQDAAYYTSTHFSPDFSESFGSIATNERQCVLNISHRYGDGGFFKFLVENYGKLPKTLQHFPIQTSEAFEAQINAIRNEVNDCPYDGRISRIFSKEISEAKTEKEGIEKKIDEFVTNFLKAKDFKNYDPVKNAPKAFTESLYLAYLFSASAHENRLFSDIGISTYVDLRPYLSKPADFNNCCHISSVTPISQVSPTMKLSEIAQNMRNDLKEKMKNGEQFAFIKGKLANKEFPGIWLEVTNMGPIRIKKPIKDAWASLTMISQKRLVSVMTFSVIDGNRNDVVTRFRYSPYQLGRGEAEKMSGCIDYFLKNISFDRNVRDVFDEIKYIYRQL